MKPSAKLVFQGRALKLDDKLLLGQGGEARVYQHPSLDLALKIFHDVDPHDPLSVRTAALRVEKLHAWTARQANAPALVVAPRELILNDRGDVVGYAMRKIAGAVDIAALANRRTRAALGDNGAFLSIFRALLTALEELHRTDIVVGDFNDGNVVLDPSVAPFFIDADSMQLGALPCPVAHERFLDPRLYGRSLVDTACFDGGSDGFALRVLLFQSLLCVHPYGGVHTKFPTLLRRAESSHSILRGDVSLPRAAIPFVTMSDDLLDDFTRCFDRGERTPMDRKLLDIRFRMCSCGVEHARNTCPICKVAVQAPAIRTQGGVTEETIVETRGLVLLARSFGGHLAFLVEENGRVRREDHSTVLQGKPPAGARFEIAGDATWVGLAHDLVKIRNEQVADRAMTSTMKGTPIFAAGRFGLWIVEGDVLVHHESRARVGRVLEDQTALLSGDAGGIAAYRAGRMLRAVFFRDGAFVDVDLPQPAGKLIDLDVTFSDTEAGDEGSLLIGMASDIDGKRTHARVLVDTRGRWRIASIEGAPDSDPILQSIRGACIANGRIVCATSEGVCAIDVDAKARQLHGGSIFVDTRPFVDATVELLPGTGGTLVVVSQQAITRLRLNGSRN